MKQFLNLLKLEYDRVFLPVGVIAVIMVILQAILFRLGRLHRVSGHVPLSYLIDAGGIPIVFAIAFAGLLAVAGASFVMNYMPSKSIYALLTLPAKRSHVYMAKLSAMLLAGLVLVCVQMILLVVFSFINRTGAVFDDFTLRRNADLYLSLLDTEFLRIIFPPDLFSLMFSVLGFFGSICMTLYLASAFRAGRRAHVVIAGAVWLGILLVTFPLSDYSLSMNLVNLLLLAVIPAAACVKGIRLFESGEVAR